MSQPNQPPARPPELQPVRGYLAADALAVAAAWAEQEGLGPVRAVEVTVTAADGKRYTLASLDGA